MLCTEFCLKTVDWSSGVTWRHIIGVGVLGGIGFTVSIFISGLSYDVDALTSQAKIGILIGSILSAVTGFALLRAVPRTT